jgi:hypothetical protein
MPLWLLLVPTAALAAPEGKIVIGAQPREINVVDDVGVGDHFPSQVPGTAPYRLPPLDTVRPAPAAVAETPPERTASDPQEWATLQKPPEAVKPSPVEAVKPAAVVAPPTTIEPAAPAAVVAQAPAAATAPDFEREALGRASRALVQGKCDRELPSLAELAEQGDRPETKARARILRARCFVQRAKQTEALAEYLAYLKDFPDGSWVSEARGAVAAQ